MVYKRNYKRRVMKKRAKRTLYRRRRYNKKMGTFNYPVPKSRICKLKYVEQITINPALGIVGSYVFSANGLYDPNTTGSGHQPYGFDQMMAFYNHYQVLGAKITVSATNSQDGNGMWMGIKVDDSGTLITTDPVNLLEQPMLRRTIISNQYSKTLNLSHTFSTKKFYSDKGIKSTYNAELSGDASSNPADQAYFIVMVGPFTSLQDVGALPCIVEIEYTAKFFEPKELPFS